MPPTERKSKMTRWRAASLIGVYVLAGVHFVHWKLNGWTLAPVEPSEMFDTLHLGVITVGFLFMAGVVVATAIFGRFFCSWGCHILALQDLSAWILRKLRIPTKPIRSRTLVWVPPLAAIYLFVWPQVERLLAGKPLPTLHTVSDADGWTSFTTTDLLRSFPGLGMTLFTLAVCGFAIVYFLGSRSFCSYACPYGAIFAVADRVAPLRIVAGKGTCSSCGACIAACPSSVRVIEEVQLFGTVINANCMKDLDCVSVCPTDALKYGVARPPALKSWWKLPGLEKDYDFTLGEDLLMAGTFVVLLPVFRGLYDEVSLLLALALAAVVAYLLIVGLRLFRSEHVQLAHLPLKLQGHFTTPGKWVAMALIGLAALVLHSGWVQYHTYAGKWAVAAVDNSVNDAQNSADPLELSPTSAAPGARPSPQLTRAIYHFEQAAKWGLVCPRGLRLQLAKRYRQAGDVAGARNELNALLAKNPNDHATRLQLARLWLLEGRGELARRQAEVVLAPAGGAESEPSVHSPAAGPLAAAHYLLGDLDARRGDRRAAIEHFEQSIELDPHQAEVHLALGSLLAMAGDPDKAAAQLSQAVELSPHSPAAHNNLATVLVELGREEEALQHYEQLIELMPQSPVAPTSAGVLLLELNRPDEAEKMFKIALNRQSDYAAAQKGLESVHQHRHKGTSSPAID